MCLKRAVHEPRLLAGSGSPRNGGLLKLTMRHSAVRTKGQTNPTCSLFATAAAASSLLCAFWPPRGGPLRTKLNYHGNSHRRTHVCRLFSRRTMGRADPEENFSQRTHDPKHVPLMCHCVGTQIQPCSVFFPPSLSPSEWLARSFRLSEHVSFAPLLIVYKVKAL